MQDNKPGWSGKATLDMASMRGSQMKSSIRFTYAISAFGSPCRHHLYCIQFPFDASRKTLLCQCYPSRLDIMHALRPFTTSNGVEHTYVDIPSQCNSRSPYIYSINN